jgi:hypothetical protein
MCGLHDVWDILRMGRLDKWDVKYAGNTCTWDDMLQGTPLGGTIKRSILSGSHHVTWSPNKLWRSNSIFNL